MNKATPAVGGPSFEVMPGVVLGSFLEPPFVTSLSRKLVCGFGDQVCLSLNYASVTK